MTKTVLLGVMLAMSATLVSKSAHLSGEWWFWWGVMVATAAAFIATTVNGADGTHYSDVMEADTDETNVLHDHRASRRVGA